MSGVRAVLFDFGGVLVDSPVAVLRAYEREHGLSEGAINRAVVEAGEQGPWARLERGELDLDVFVGMFEADLAARGLEVDVGALMDRIGRLEPRPVMLDAVRRARQRVPVALGTNNWREPGMDVWMASLRTEFDAVVESCELGIRKPDPRFYEIACARLGVEPAGVVFLDDLGRNLKPARALGMTTIKVGDAHEAVAALDAALEGGWRGRS